MTKLRNFSLYNEICALVVVLFLEEVNRNVSPYGS